MAFDAFAFFNAKVMVVTCLHILMCQNKETVMKIAEVCIDNSCEIYIYILARACLYATALSLSLSLFCLVNCVLHF